MSKAETSAMIDWLQVLEKGFAAFFIAMAGEGGRMLQQVLRLEKKYLLTLDEAKYMSGKLQQIMHQDPHNGADGFYCQGKQHPCHL